MSALPANGTTAIVSTERMQGPCAPVSMRMIEQRFTTMSGMDKGRNFKHNTRGTRFFVLTDLSDAGPKWSQYCGPPVTVYTAMEVKNRGHNGGSRGRKSALEPRPRVQAPGHGSFSPVATFKLCS